MGGQVVKTADGEQQLPEGAELVELKPDTAYVMRFSRTLQPGEGDALARFWGQIAVNHQCGIVIMMPEGVTFESLDEYAERYHQAKIKESYGSFADPSLGRPWDAMCDRFHVGDCVVELHYSANQGREDAERVHRQLTEPTTTTAGGPVEMCTGFQGPGAVPAKGMVYGPGGVTCYRDYGSGVGQRYEELERELNRFPARIELAQEGIMDKPSVGRIVHFVPHSGELTDKHQAAIITDVVGDSPTAAVEMMVFQSRAMAVGTAKQCVDVPYSAQKMPGTWHWPERA